MEVGKIFYQTPDGLVIPRDYTDRHHAVWKKDWYTTTFERQKFREMGGMVLRLDIKAHRELHANVEPPEKPNHNLMHGMFDYNKKNLDTQNPYERFEELTSMLGRIADIGGPNAEDAHKLQQNFLDQQIYIDQGKVEIYHG